jgi:hypothetical protein
MADEVVGIKVKVDGSEAVESTKSLRAQLKEATADVAALSEKFGVSSKATIEAAKRASELKDRIGDAKTLIDAFNPDAKFKAFSASLTGVAGGFAAVQGAMALFGSENENVQKALLKVQAAMAFSQGLQAVGESIDSFKQLGAVIQNTTLFQKANSAATSAAAAVQKLFTGAVDTTTVGFKNLKFAIAATGIGLLVVAIGYLISNFEELSSAMSKSTDVELEHARAQESASKAIADYTMKLYSVQNALEGAKKGTISKKDALKEYNDKLGDTIGYAGSLEQAERLMAANTTVVIKSIKLRAEAQVMYAKAAEYSGKIISGETTEIGFWEGFYNHISSLGDWGKTAVANAEDMSKKVEVAQKAIKGLQAEGDKLSKEAIENDKLLQKGLSTKPGSTKSSGKSKEESQAEKDKKERDAAELEAQKRLQKLKDDTEVAGIEDQYKSRKLAIEKATIQEIKDINANEKLKQETKDALIIALNTKSKVEIDKIDKEQKDAKDKKDKEDQKKLLEDDRKFRELTLQGKIEDIDKEIAKKDQDFEDDKIRFADKMALLDEQKLIELENLELTNSQKLEIDKKYSDAKEKILEDQTAAEQKAHDARVSLQLELLDTASTVIGGLSTLFDQGSAASKTLALTDIAIGTAKGFVQGLDIAQKGAQASGPAAPFAFPIFYATQVAAVLNAVAKAKGILSSTKGGASGGGSISAPSMTSASAPISPAAPIQNTMTQLSPNSINQLGSATNRAYVVESDVTNSQERIKRINRAARLT